MGLFGLFASMVGLGAMAKDGISNNIHEQKSFERAKAEGRSWYSGTGAKIYSMETGKECIMSFENGHTMLRDLKTNQLIEDMTLTDNLKRETEQKKESLTNGCVFYRKAEWDVKGYECNVWVSDKIPGYFHRAKYNDGRIMFHQGNLCDAHWANRKVKEVNQRGISQNERKDYYPDGVLKTLEESTRRNNAERIEKAKSKGLAFYSPLEIVERDGKRVASDWLVNYRSVDDNSVFIYNYQNQYYVKAIETVTEKEIRLPHHKEVERIEKVTTYVEDPNGIRYNADGTEWVED